MRRVWCWILLAAALGAVSMPALAQTNGSVVDAATADGEFTALVAALQAAGLEDELQTDGPFTVFAPTDDAFVAALAALGVTPDELFDDPERLRDLLLYHVIEGEFSADALMTMDSATMVNEGVVIFTVVDGQLVLNNAVTITRSIPADNGIIHVIDTVLLPPADVGVQVEPVVVVDNAATPGAAQLRVAHFSPDMPAVDIYVDGLLSDIAALEYGGISPWAQFPAGAYEITLVPQGALIEEAVFGPMEVILAPDSWTMLAVIGSNAENTIRVALIEETPEMAIAANETRVTFFHAIADATALDVIIGDNTVLIENIAYTEFATLALPASSYDLKLVATGTSAPILYDIPDTPLAAGGNTFFGITGTTDAPSVAVSEVSAEEIALLGAMTSESEIELVLVEGGDLMDAVIADGRFTTLVAMIDAAGLTAALREPGPYTLLAPTDDAFAALPEGTLNALLSDPQTLSTLLLYHVIPNEMMALDLSANESADTLLGVPISVSLVDGAATFNGTAQFVATDLPASNGVIHVIDTVLIPPSE